MIDLSKFVDKKVRVTWRNGKVIEGRIKKSDYITKPYLFSNGVWFTTYTRDGRYFAQNPEDAVYDIIHIQEIKPMNHYEELEKQVAEMQKEIDRLKAEEKKKPEITIENSKVGDVLEDGCVVVDKQGNMVLLAAPASTEVRCEWSNEFSDVFVVLKSQGFNPSQWFVPSKEQLQLAYKNCKQHFASFIYWSSTEVSSTIACNLGFIIGSISSCPKSLSFCVRAFRVVNF
jgi:hypothetical protein